MVHVALGGILIVAVIFITAILFTIWLVAAVGRLIWRVLAGGSAPTRSRGVLDSQMCVRDRCRAVNPAQAQFCRRCGTNLSAAAAHRRVAV